MEFIVISNDKLKMILSEDEMLEYDIHPDSFNYAESTSKNALKSLLDRALCETGFDSRKTKLFVQMFSSKTGGCEIFISKIEEQHHNVLEKEYQSNKKQLLCYIFLDFKTLCNLCLRIKQTDRKYKTSLYSDNKTKYCLIFLKNDRTPAYHSGDHNDVFYPPYLSEYGNTEESDAKFLDYLAEYYNCIINENAVEKVSSIFL